MKRLSPVLAISAALSMLVVAGVWSVTASARGVDPKPLAPHKQASLPPLPFGPHDPLPRPTAVVTQVFQFAAEHPEVLTYMPCFCGCDHMGHKGNEDCFVRQRAANGDVVAWEPHGSECQVCIDVGQQAMQMYSSGASLKTIRDAIEKKYAGTYQFHTPTPPVPAPAPKK